MLNITTTSIGKIERFSGQFSQVFTNFIDDAIGTIEDKSIITITTTLKNKQVEITIRETLEREFQRRI